MTREICFDLIFGTVVILMTWLLIVVMWAIFDDGYSAQHLKAAGVAVPSASSYVPNE